MKPTFCFRKAAPPVFPLKRSTKLTQAARSQPPAQNAGRTNQGPGHVATETQRTPKPRFAAAVDSELSRSSSTVTPFRKYLLYGSMLGAGGFACYCAYLFMSYRQLLESSEALGKDATTKLAGDVRSQADVSSRFDTIAKDYDNQVGQTEWIMGLTKRRKKLIAQAKGHVLEVGVGTARNTTFYAEELDRQSMKASKSGAKAEKRGLVAWISSPGDSATEDNSIKSLTFVDKSAQMIDVAQIKWQQEERQREAVAKKRGLWTSVPGRSVRQVGIGGESIRWIVGDAEKVNEIPPAGTTVKVTQMEKDSGQTSSSESSSSFMHKIKGLFGYDTTSTKQTITPPVVGASNANGTYDTIIETFGLCSTPDPIALLNNLGRLCKTSPQPSSTANREGSQDRGRILLLEHGRSYYDWLNRILDLSAPGHAAKFGCWYNRDIGKLVEDSELEVVSIKRYHLGTTWEMVLQPKL